MKRALSGWLNDSKKYNKAAVKSKRDWPRLADEYELLEECGKGASGAVYRARCRTMKSGDVAVKQVNLETVGAEVDTFVSETQTMSLLHHPNLLPLHCSFLHKESLWMVMPFVSGGSLHHVMAYKFPDGLDEACICTVVHETLKGLVYLHNHGIIHRDIKAGNILIGQDGQTWLADFGISAKTNRNGSWGKGGGQRHTFAGTICWMAPEIMQGDNYDEKADIWSLGMTMLELAYGRTPFDKMSTMKVLTTVLNDDPPRLEERSGERVWSKHFRDIVARCLVKESEDRPSAEQLLNHKFFKGVRGKELIQAELCSGIPDAKERSQELHARIQQGLELANEEAHKTAWNFDLTCLRDSLPQDVDPAGGKPFARRGSADNMTSSSHSLSQDSNLSRASPSEQAGGSGAPDWDWGDNASPSTSMLYPLPPSRVSPTASLSPRGGNLAAAAAQQQQQGGQSPGHMRGPAQSPMRQAHSADMAGVRVGGGGVMVNGAVVNPQQLRGRGAAAAEAQQRLNKLRSFNVQKKGRFVVYEEGGSGHSSPAASAAASMRRGRTGSTGGLCEDDYHEKLLRESQRLQQQHSMSTGGSVGSNGASPGGSGHAGDAFRPRGVVVGAGAVGPGHRQQQLSTGGRHGAHPPVRIVVGGQPQHGK